MFDAETLAHELNVAHLQQGKLLGLLDAIGLAPAQEIGRELWVQVAMATAAIEGEKLNLEAVRSSVAHRLGLADAPSPDRHVDGLVQVMQDATEGCRAVLDSDHCDPMQIVNGGPWRERVHYTAPASTRVADEMQRFLAWFEATRLSRASLPGMNGIARAALAHLWFETIHPGKVSRATDCRL